MSTPMSGFAANVRYLWDKQAVALPLIFGPILPSLPLPRADMTNKTIILTGGNSGIGFGIAQQLAALNSTLILACRNANKANSAVRKLLEEYPNAKIQALSLDTSSLDSVRQFAQNWNRGRVDVLMHNAGIASLPEDTLYTSDGLELMYQTNFLGSFLLTQLLEPHLAPDARVVLTSSAGAYQTVAPSRFALTRTLNTVEPGFHCLGSVGSSSENYCQTKLMQVAFAKLLQQRFDRDPTTRRMAFSWEPGLVKTGMEQALKEASWAKDPAWVVLAWFIERTAVPVEQGASTGVQLAVTREKEVEAGKGHYWSRQMVRISPVDFWDQELLDRLWIRWCADAEVAWT